MVKFSKTFREGVEKTLAEMANGNKDIAEVPYSNSMVLVRAGSNEAKARASKSDRVAVVKYGTQEYFLCHK